MSEMTDVMNDFTPPTSEDDEMLEAFEIPSKISLEEEIIARSSGSHDPMPMLDVIFARMATGFSPMLKSKNGLLAEVSPAEISYRPWGKLVSSLDPNGVAAMAKSSLEGGIFMAFDAAFLHAVVVQQMGGKVSNFDVMRRAPTTLEQAFAKRLFEQCLEELSLHFSRIVEVNFQLDSIEGPSQLSALMSNEALMAVCEFEVEMGPVIGRVSLILPMQTLEPARDRLSKMFLGDKLGSDSSWRDHFADNINDANMTLQVELHRLPVSLADVLEWRPGTTIDLDIGPEKCATVYCAGLAILQGETGRKRNGRIALRINKELNSEGKDRDDEHLLLD